METLYIHIPTDSTQREPLLCVHIDHLIATDQLTETQSVLFDQRSPTNHDTIVMLCERLYKGAPQLHEATLLVDPRAVATHPQAVSLLAKSLPDLLSYRYSFPMTTWSPQFHRRHNRTNIMYELRTLFRLLAKKKSSQDVYTIDMLACGGKMGGGDTQYLWSQPLSDYRHTLVSSGLIDAWTLGIEPILTNDSDACMDEYVRLQSSILGQGYTRYNLHHYTHQGKYSHHQATYDAYLSYGGVGPGAVSMNSTTKTVTRMPSAIDQYDHLHPLIENENLNDRRVQAYIQRFTSHIGIKDHSAYDQILVPNHKEIVAERIQDGIINQQHNKLRLSSELLDVYDHYIQHIIDPRFLTTSDDE